MRLIAVHLSPLLFLFHFRGGFKGSGPSTCFPFHSDSLLFQSSGILVQYSHKMLSILRFELVFFALLPSVFAAPLFGINLGSSNNAATSAVSQNTVTSQLFRPALFSRAAYCSPDSVTNFTCGAACDAVKGIQILHADGDQGAVPRCESSYSHDQITRHPSIKA